MSGTLRRTLAEFRSWLTFQRVTAGVSFREMDYLINTDNGTAADNNTDRLHERPEIAPPCSWALEDTGRDERKCLLTIISPGQRQDLTIRR